jgi:hypothetical protein
MEFKYPFYIKDADPTGVEEALVWLKDFYLRYPTGNEIGEALHQFRKEHDMIKEVEEKKKRIKKLADEIDEE